MVHDLMEFQSHYLHTPLEDTCTCAQAWIKNTCQIHEMLYERGNMLMSFRLGLHPGRDAWDPRCETQRVATSWPRHTLGSAFSAKVERRLACNCKRRPALHRIPPKQHLLPHSTFFLVVFGRIVLASTLTMCRHIALRRHMLRPIHVLSYGFWTYHT